MKLIRVMRELFCKPWLLDPQTHKQLCDIVQDHISGKAHEKGERVETIEEELAAIDQALNVKPYSVTDGIALYEIDGIISRKVSSIVKSSGVVDVDEISDVLTMMEQDETVTGIILKIDSPGGSVSGVPELSKQISQLNQVKPIVVFADGLLASAAYWLGSGSSVIVASPSSEIGSIGVYAVAIDSSRAAEMQGLEVNLFASGKFKGMGVDGVKWQDEWKAQMKKDVATVYDWFTSDVIRNRGNVSNEAMQGQTFFASEAKANKLIDVVGSLADARNELLDILSVKGNA